MMELSQLNPGDIVYAATDLHNDGGIPDLPADALIACAGTRGVIVNIGHLEADPNRGLFLVRFEGADLVLGPPTGCWAEELGAQPSAEPSAILPHRATPASESSPARALAEFVSTSRTDASEG